MKVLFDIGNTSIDWAVEFGNRFISRGKFSYDVNFNLKQLQHELKDIRQGKPEHILVSSVGDDNINDLLQAWARQYWQLELWQPAVLSEYRGLRNSYSDLQQIGIDRWLAMVAAWKKYKTAICIASCGSALAIDLIDASGLHRGGYIIPGIKMMQRTLITNAEKINVSIIDQVSIKPANNTRAAIGNGSCLANVATINQVTRMFINELQIKPKCIITGGDAVLIQSMLQYDFHYFPDLVLQGLSIMHRANQ